MAIENIHNKKLERLGFSYERGGVHTTRMMMFGGAWRFRRSQLDQWIAASINETKPKGWE